MLDKVKEDKIKHPIEYEKIKRKLDGRKKKEAFILFQRLLAQKIEIKIDTVIKKASKAIYRKLRKANDYKEYYKNKNIIKRKEKKKSKLELFLEYLDNTDNE